MNKTKPHSRQYQAQQRNVANNLCAYSKQHGPPVNGQECCRACLDKKRVLARTRKGCQPYSVTGMGRPPLGTPKAIANAGKIKRLEQQRDKRLAMIERAKAKFEAKKASHMEWITWINEELAKFGVSPGSEKQYSEPKSNPKGIVATLTSFIWPNPENNVLR